MADYSIFYQNVSGYHWNIKGEKFFELHDKFQELYEDLFVKIEFEDSADGDESSDITMSDPANYTLKLLTDDTYTLQLENKK